MISFWIVFAASFTASIATGLGILAITRFGRGGGRNTNYFVSFASGVLIAVALVHIIPESMELAPDAIFYFLGGYFGMFLANQFFQVFFPSTDDPAAGKRMVSLLGITFHSFVDGIIYAVTFNVSVFTGILSAIGMILHEFPEGILSYQFIRLSGRNKTNSALIAFLTAGLTTPFGALAGFLIIRDISGMALGNLLGAAGGALLYVGASHLIPEVESERQFFPLLALLGAALMAAIVLLSGH